MFLHSFEQGGLGFGWGSVDFVGEQDLGKDWSFDETQLACPRLGLLDNIRPGDIRGHQIGRELDAMKVECHGLSERSHHQRLGESRYTFQ